MLRPGDVIFYGRNTSDFCRAVEKVVSNNDFFHVAIVSAIGTIVEASTSGVTEYRSLRDSIKQNSPGYLEIVSPAISEHERLQAATLASTKIGLKYNDLFAADLLNSEGNESYYCSQLITEAFRDSEMKWPAHTLNFKDEQGNLIEFWRDYFEKKGGRQVPQGDEGSHPAQLRKSPVFEVSYLQLPVQRYTDTVFCSEMSTKSKNIVSRCMRRCFSVCVSPSAHTLSRAPRALPFQLYSLFFLLQT